MHDTVHFTVMTEVIAGTSFRNCAKTGLKYISPALDLSRAEL
jgi:hypothetical protein